MRPAEDVILVHELDREGWNRSQISRLSGIPRSTVKDWLRNDHVERARSRCPRCGHASNDFSRLPGASYAYLLGLYLGDGVISRGRGRCFRLRITMDSRYPGVIEAARDAMRSVMPSSRVNVRERAADRATEVSSYSNAWPCLIPQTGPGPKHARAIALADWQTTIVDRWPGDFARGLIHSDGCRVINRVGGRDYPRYFFTQVSDDIRALFCEACIRLGVRYTQSSRKNISIAASASVSLLDELGAAKT